MKLKLKSELNLKWEIVAQSLGKPWNGYRANSLDIPWRFVMTLSELLGEIVHSPSGALTNSWMHGH